ncbi:MAG: phosphatase PAP2 family protein [Betaproteobacteria bacterium]|nr:phosphatase PAP2 family protein [Betaproteobacteria bacterium]
MPSSRSRARTRCRSPRSRSPGWRRRAGGLDRRVAAAASIILVVALSRLYLQVHFPTDVAIGVIAGAAWAIGLRLFLGARA